MPDVSLQQTSLYVQHPTQNIQTNWISLEFLEMVTTKGCLENATITTATIKNTISILSKTSVLKCDAAR